MDFIERWFYLSPDHGSGTTEALLLLVAAAFLIAIAGRRRLADLTRRLVRREKDER